MLRVDLEAAGIPYETDSGFADFHSLRGRFHLLRGFLWRERQDVPNSRAAFKPEPDYRNLRQGLIA